MVYTVTFNPALDYIIKIENFEIGKINRSNKLDLSRLHRIYPLNDSAWKIVLKIEYKSLKYRN